MFMEGRLSMVMTSFLSKLIDTFNAIPINTVEGYFCYIDKLIQSLYSESKYTK